MPTAVAEHDQFSGSRTLHAARAIVALAGAEVIGKASTLVILIGAARLLGPDEFGVFAFSLSLGLLAAAIPTWGLDDLLVQRGSANRRLLPAQLAQVLAFRTGLGVPVAVGLIVLAPLQRDGATAVAAACVALAPVLDTFSEAFRAAATALQRQLLVAVVHIVQRLTTAVLALAVLLTRPSLLVLSLVFLGGSILGLIMLAVAVSRVGVRPDLTRISTGDLRSFARGSWIIAVDALALMAVARLDVVLLGWWDGDRAAGVYAASYRLVDTVLFMSWAVARAVFPVMAADTDTASVRRGTERALTVIGTLFAPYAVVLLLRPHEVLQLLYGEAYADAGAHALAWLSLTPLLFGAAYVTSYALISRGPVLSLVLASGVTVTINLGLNAVLIPPLGPTGAAMATSAAYGALFFATLVPVVRRFGAGVIRGRSHLPGAAGCIAVAIVLWSPLPLIPALVLAAAAYLAVWAPMAWLVDREVLHVLTGLARRAR